MTEPTQPSADADAQAAAAPRPSQAAPSGGLRWAIRAIFTLATILTVAAVFAIFANRQVLNADNWSDTSTALIENNAVRTQVSDYLVKQLFSHVDVSKVLAGALPTSLQALAGPVTGRLESVAQKGTYDLLSRRDVQDAWKQSQKFAAERFIAIVDGKSKTVQLQGDTVYVDLRPILTQVADSLGLPASLVQQLPANVARLDVMTSDQIGTVQTVVKLIKGLSWVLPLLALLLFALAIYLSRTRRRQALLITGLDLVVAGVIVVVARVVAGHAIVNSLAATRAVKPAAQATWSIGTEMLKNSAEAVIIIGLIVMLVAAFAVLLARRTPSLNTTNR